METNRNICEAREITKVLAQHVTITVTLIVIVKGKATTRARITLIANATVNVIEMDLVKNVNVTGRAHEAVVTTVNAKAILMGKENVIVTVRDRVIVVVSVTKTVIVMEMVRHLAVKKGIVIERKEKILIRLAIREPLTTNMIKKKGKWSSLFL